MLPETARSVPAPLVGVAAPHKGGGSARARFNEVGQRPELISQ
jgi:hypothetical protein